MAYRINNAYVRFDVIDYTGSNVLSSFSLKETPLTFRPDFSKAAILNTGIASSFGNSTISNKNLRWDFGDGTFSNNLTAVHAYSWPGLYTVKLTIFDNSGKAYDSSYRPQIEIYDYVSTQIAFQDYGRLVYDVPAGKTLGPLKLNTYNSWQNYGALSATGCTINLYASGAKGDYNYLPISSTDKWSHLKQLSRFYKTVYLNDEASYEPIESITAPQTNIYVKKINNRLKVCPANDEGSIFVGTTGSCEFWYTDERPGNLTTEDNPIFIFATVDTSKFDDAFTEKNNAFKYIDTPPYGIQNVQPAVFPGVKTRYNPASRLSITTTGIDGEGAFSTTKFEIPKISWQQTEIPFVVKFKDDENYTTKNYPPLSSSYVVSPTIAPQATCDVQLGIVTYESGSARKLDNVDFYEDFTAATPQSIGCFYKGYFVSQNSSKSCVLTAAVNVVEPVFYAKDAIVGWIAIPQYNSAFRVLRQESFNKNIRGSKLVTFTDSETLFNTGDSRNMYAITVAPSGTRPEADYQTWVADFTKDRIYKYDIYGAALPVYYTLSITGDYIPNYYYPLSAMPTIINNQVIVTDYTSTAVNGIRAQASPNNIAIDRHNNIWVTLLDSGSSIKIDSNTGYVTTVAYTEPSTGNLSLSSTTLSSAYTTLSGFAGESVILPSSIDVDQNNDVWVAYTHPAFNRLVKYQGENNETPAARILHNIQFPQNITPEEICIDRNKFVWVTAHNHNYGRVSFSTSNDLLYKFDLNGNIVSGFPLSGFKQIGNLTIDGNQNAWVSQDRETITKINSSDLSMSNYLAGASNNQTNYIGSIGGMTCDTSNFIWVINNFDKQLYIINSERPPGDYFSYEYAIPLDFPSTTLTSVDTYSSIPGQYSDGLQEFQAYGDWNGYRWINKYSVSSSTIRTITGSSNMFDVYSSSGSYNVSKVNEDWDAANYYNSLRYQESLLDKQVFFEQFLGVIVGGLSAQPYEIGKTVYEKIANFVSNRTDIDKCNLDALLNFCRELTIEFEEYNYLFPPQIRRLVDLLSIKQSNLWGTQNKYTLNFDNRGTIIPNETYGVNLGTEVDSLSGVIYSGTPVVAYEIFSGTYNVVNTNIFSTLTSYPLSTYSPDWGWCLSVPDTVRGTAISSYYKFYRFLSELSNKYYNNIIDWENPMTMLTPTNSSFDAWDRDDDGIMQNMFSYELTKGFKLFTSAANITYNS
jgi:hypothetical protein